MRPDKAAQARTKRESSVSSGLIAAGGAQHGQVVFDRARPGKAISDVPLSRLQTSRLEAKVDGQRRHVRAKADRQASLRTARIVAKSRMRVGCGPADRTSTTTSERDPAAPPDRHEFSQLTKMRG